MATRRGPSTTLTVCKPRIRKAAKCGDLVLAFNGKALNPAEPHSVRWAGVVSEVIPLKDYWNDPRFEGKKPGRPGRPRGPGEAPDNIYRPTTTGGLEQVENTTHEPDHMATDVSGVNSLVLTPSWYFGPAVAVLPSNFNLRIIGGRRGERRFEIDDATWHELKQWLDQSAPDARSGGASVEGDIRCASNRRSRRTAARRRC
jgi:Nucleotide modification associated domain 2